RTALVDLGSRIEHRALFRLPAGSTAEHAGELERWLRERMPDASYYRVRTFTEAQPSLRRSFIRMGRYLGLVGLLSLLVGGVGVAQVARAWLASRMDDVAVMRCLGVRSGEVIATFTLQVLAMALAASVIGALLGAA